MEGAAAPPFPPSAFRSSGLWPPDAFALSYPIRWGRRIANSFAYTDGLTVCRFGQADTLGQKISESSLDGLRSDPDLRMAVLFDTGSNTGADLHIPRLTFAAGHPLSAIASLRLMAGIALTTPEVSMPGDVVTVLRLGTHIGAGLGPPSLPRQRLLAGLLGILLAHVMDDPGGVIASELPGATIRVGAVLRHRLLVLLSQYPPVICDDDTWHMAGAGIPAGLLSSVPFTLSQGAVPFAWTVEECPLTDVGHVAIVRLTRESAPGHSALRCAHQMLSVILSAWRRSPLGDDPTAWELDRLEVLVDTSTPWAYSGPDRGAFSSSSAPSGLALQRLGQLVGLAVSAPGVTNPADGVCVARWRNHIGLGVGPGDDFLTRLAAAALSIVLATPSGSARRDLLLAHAPAALAFHLIEALQSLAADCPPTIDLGGQLVVPGFVHFCYHLSFMFIRSHLVRVQSCLRRMREAIGAWPLP